MISPEQIASETRIVWEADPADFDYVRQSLAYAGTRTRPVPWYVGRRLGFAVLAADAESARVAPGTFERRVFWVKDYDRHAEPEGPYSRGAPAEAVDPRTVSPRACGSLTDRAWRPS